MAKDSQPRDHWCRGFCLDTLGDLSRSAGDDFPVRRSFHPPLPSSDPSSDLVIPQYEPGARSATESVGPSNQGTEASILYYLFGFSRYFPAHCPDLELTSRRRDYGCGRMTVELCCIHFAGTAHELLAGPPLPLPSEQEHTVGFGKTVRGSHNCGSLVASNTKNKRKVKHGGSQCRGVQSCTYSIDRRLLGSCQSYAHFHSWVHRPKVLGLGHSIIGYKVSKPVFGPQRWVQDPHPRTRLFLVDSLESRLPKPCRNQDAGGNRTKRLRSAVIHQRRSSRAPLV